MKKWIIDTLVGTVVLSLAAGLVLVLAMLISLDDEVNVSNTDNGCIAVTTITRSAWFENTKLTKVYCP